MTIFDLVENNKYLADHIDQPMVYCPKCNTPTVDTGWSIVNCKDCGENLIRRTDELYHRNTG